MLKVLKGLKKIKNKILNDPFKDCSYENTPTYTLSGKRCRGKILKVYDGDTLWIALPFPENQIFKYKARLFGYDSPEMKPSKDDSDRKEIINRAILAKKRLEELTHEGVLDIELLEYDKYGRILIKIYKNGVCLNDQMVKEGFGKPYFGGRKS
jgi:endonuclease YncB( thermonuclease family)